MYFDLGGHRFPETTEMENKIKELDQRFDLVMIQDYFEESLILLQDLLCFSDEDLIVFKVNQRKKKPIEKNKQFNASQIKNLSKLQYADVKLYDYFLKKHKLAVENFGLQKMQKRVIELKKLKKKLFDECVAEELTTFDDRFKFKTYCRDTNVYVKKENSSEICELLTLHFTPLQINLEQQMKRNKIKN